MNVKFYPKTVDYRSAESAEITFKGNALGKERSTFIRLSEEVHNVPIFISKGMQENSVAIKLAQKLALEKDANVLLMCKPYIFREIIKNSNAIMEAHLKYDAQKNIIIYYVIVKDKKSFLLTAFENWN